MKISSEVSADKLRGGFYSPEALVRVCFDRVDSLLARSGPLRMLEPSAGDGAFIQGLRRHQLATKVEWTTAVEIIDSEAARCAASMAASQTPGEVVNDSVLAWALHNNEPYDVAVGNPPFVRFQFVDERERLFTDALGAKLGAEFRGVSNLWLPVLVSAIATLRPGGAFAFIVPAESFTGIAGHEVREWLLERVHQLHVDLFMPGSFPSVLQEVVILSGRMLADGCRATRDMHFREHGRTTQREWLHKNIGQFRTWTRFLLSPDQVGHLQAAANLKTVAPLGSVVRFEVATVTGANGFFCVNDETVDQYRLEEWVRPLLPRTRHAVGLSYTEEDHKQVLVDGLPGHLLDFSATKPDPMRRRGPRTYLRHGESLDLHKRFKCRIRKPWWRVPVVAPGQMLMAKRAHLFPRVIVNEAQVVTTDTIYRGRLLAKTTSMTARDFTAAFHNSLTLLTAEIEGRSFGGGVLELVPSEISRLSVPLPENMGDEFERLDWVCRGAGEQNADVLIEETDALVSKKTDGLSKELLDQLRDARQVLAGLRFARN